MAKFKVYELAKELNKSSKEVVAFLQEKGIEVKAAQSSVDDAAAELVKKHFGGQSEVKTVEEPKAEMQKSDAVKKDTLATEKSTAPPAASATSRWLYIWMTRRGISSVFPDSLSMRQTLIASSRW